VSIRFHIPITFLARPWGMRSGIAGMNRCRLGLQFAARKALIYDHLRPRPIASLRSLGSSSRGETVAHTMPQYWPIQWPGPSVLSAGRLLLNAVYLRLTTPLGVCLELAAATPPLPPFHPILKQILK